MDDQLPESLPRNEREEKRRAQEYEEQVASALDDTPRAAELRELCEVLQRRRSTLERDFDSTHDMDERAHLQKMLDDLNEQIRVLDEEARINQFVENTVKFSHEVRRLSEG